MVQILSGLITYLLLAIYCQEEHGEPVSIARVLQLRNEIRNGRRFLELTILSCLDANAKNSAGK